MNNAKNTTLFPYLERLLDGEKVEWKTLGEVAEYVRQRVAVDQLCAQTYVGVDNLLPNRAGKQDSNYIPTEGNAIAYQPNDILIGNIRPYLKKNWKADNEGGASADVLVVRITNSLLTPGYLYHLLADDRFFSYDMQHAKGAKMPRGNKEKILDYVLPIPLSAYKPVLWRFSTSSHSWRRNSKPNCRQSWRRVGSNMRIIATSFLISHNTPPLNVNIEWRTLGEMAEIGTGSSNRQDEAENGVYPFYVRSKNILRSSTYQFDETAIIIPGEGGIGDIFHYAEGKYALHQRAYRIKVNAENELFPKFIFYYMTNAFKPFILSRCVGATATSIRKPMLTDFPIPLPPLSEQRRIVDILDRFDTLTNSISEGLTKEIALRRKQYAYYRDALLSFPRPEVSA